MSFPYFVEGKRHGTLWIHGPEVPCPVQGDPERVALHWTPMQGSYVIVSPAVKQGHVVEIGCSYLLLGDDNGERVLQDSRISALFKIIAQSPPNCSLGPANIIVFLLDDKKAATSKKNRLTFAEALLVGPVNRATNQAALKHLLQTSGMGDSIQVTLYQGHPRSFLDVDGRPLFSKKNSK